MRKYDAIKQRTKEEKKIELIKMTILDAWFWVKSRVFLSIMTENTTAQLTSAPELGRSRRKHHNLSGAPKASQRLSETAKGGRSGSAVRKYTGHVGERIR